MTVVVHIERLLVEGAPLRGRDARLFQAAVEAELSRLFTAEGFADGMTSAAVPALRGAGISWSRGERPDALGTRVGGAVYGSLRS